MSRLDRSEDPLSQALRSLPAERASRDFTAGVLRRLDRPASPTLLRHRGWLAAAALLLLVLSLPVARELDRRKSVARIRQETAELQRQKSDLERRVEALRARYDRESVVYLGGDEDVDLVVDMRPLAAGLGTRGFQPAVYRSGPPTP